MNGVNYIGAEKHLDKVKQNAIEYIYRVMSTK